MRRNRWRCSPSGIRLSRRVPPGGPEGGPGGQPMRRIGPGGGGHDACSVERDCPAGVLVAAGRLLRGLCPAGPPHAGLAAGGRVHTSARAHGRNPDRGARRGRPARVGGHARRAAPPLRSGGPDHPGLCRPPAAHRLWADHLPALHRGADERGAPGPAGRPCAGDRHRQRLSGCRPGRAGRGDLHYRDYPRTGGGGGAAVTGPGVHGRSGSPSRRLLWLGGRRAI